MPRIEAALRRFSVRRRTAVILALVLLPLGVLSVVSLVVLDKQQSAFQQSVQESIDTLLPLTTLEHYLQSAQLDELEAETGKPLGDARTLATRIDAIFSRMRRTAQPADLSTDLVHSAERAWTDARPVLQHLVSRPRALAQADPSLPGSEHELARSIRDIQKAREQLTHIVRARYERSAQARRTELVTLVCAWIVTLLFAAALVGLFLYSLLRPVKALGHVAERLEAGEYGARVPVLGNDELTVLSRRFNAMVAHWETTQRDLVLQAEHDALTSTLNRRGILAVFDIELTTHLEQGRPLSLILLDLDRFKHINDTFGHAAGDKALTWVADRIAETLRKSDHFGRYGGDEFIAVLPNTDQDEVRHLAQRLVAHVDRCAHGRAVYPGLSVGAATTPADGTQAAVLLEAADVALYRHKQWRRARVAHQN
ncbi:MAG: diguanylate cyclase [Salinisphaera sp.]|uniref:GGDEF domain-containing protein n=1 Tax=Salinisphaera sp. TaxID=1914330 RepID=UPI003C7D71E7